MYVCTCISYCLVSRFSAGGVCRSKRKLDGKTVIITGANTGIGLETAIDLATRKARVVMACRDEQRGQKACTEAKQRSGSENIVFRQLDLADMQSIRQFATRVLDEERQIDILINNAGEQHTLDCSDVSGIRRTVWIIKSSDIQNSLEINNQ